MKEIHTVSLCNENTEEIQQRSRKIDVWFDHFQMEFDLHIWWLSSPHEYFEMVEYEGDSSLASGRTGNRVFLHQSSIFSYVIYIGKPYEFPSFKVTGELESQPRYLGDEIRYRLRSFCTS